MAIMGRIHQLPGTHPRSLPNSFYLANPFVISAELSGSWPGAGLVFPTVASHTSNIGSASRIRSILLLYTMEPDDDDEIIFIAVSLFSTLQAYCRILETEEDVPDISNSGFELLVALFSLSQGQTDSSYTAPTHVGLLDQGFPSLRDILPTIFPEAHDFFYLYFRVTRATFNFILTKLSMRKNYHWDYKLPLNIRLVSFYIVLPTVKGIAIFLLVSDFRRALVGVFTEHFLGAFFNIFHNGADVPTMRCPQGDELEEVWQGFILLSPSSASTRFTRHIGAI